MVSLILIYIFSITKKVLFRTATLQKTDYMYANLANTCNIYGVYVCTCLLYVNERVCVCVCV